MDKGFTEEVRRASAGVLDADALPVVERLDELPDIVIETARRLESRISAVRLIKYSVPTAPLGEVSAFVAQVVEGPQIPASQWRRNPVVSLRADLDQLASLEASEILASFDEVESDWFVREPEYMAWRLGEPNTAPFKIAFGQPCSWQPSSQLLASTSNRHEVVRTLEASEVCEALARWLVASIAYHLDRSQENLDADAAVGTLRGASVIRDVTQPGRFFSRCCELAVRELGAAGPRQVPGYAGPATWYAEVCGGRGETDPASPLTESRKP